MGARGHDDRVRSVLGQSVLWHEFEQLVARQVGQVVERLDALLAEDDEDRRGQPRELCEVIGDAHLLAPLVELAVALGQVGEAAIAQLLGQLLVEALDRRQFLERHVGDLLDRREPFRDEQVGDDVVDVERVDERLRAGAELFAPAIRFLVLGEEVDAPAGELRGQPHVLPAPADGEAELIVGHHHLDLAGVLVEHHLRHLGRGQRVDHERRGVGRPRDDVDLLSLELADHRLDPAAAHADTRAHRVDARIVRQHGDLGAAAGIARHRLDLDDGVVDLGHLLGEQLGHELRLGAGQEDLRPALLAAHVVNESAHPVALVERFAGQHLVAPQQRLGAAQVDHDVAVLDALDEAVDDFALAVLVLVVLTLALGLAHPLHDHLLGGLRGDAAKVDRRQRLGQEVSGLGFGIALARLVDDDLGERVLDQLDDLEASHQANVAGLAIDFGANVVLLAVLALAGVLYGLFHGLENGVAVDAFLARHGVGNLQHLRLAGAESWFGLHFVLHPSSFVGRRDQPVGEHELGGDDLVQRYLRLAVVEGNAHAVAVHPHQPTAKSLAPVDRAARLDLRLVAGEPLEIAAPHQRPVDAGRADLEVVGAGDRILDIEQRRDGAADLGALIHRRAGPLAPLGHDLQRPASPGRHPDPDHLVAHRFERRRYEALDIALHT